MCTLISWQVFSVLPLLAYKHVQEYTEQLSVFFFFRETQVRSPVPLSGGSPPSLIPTSGDQMCSSDHVSNCTLMGYNQPDTQTYIYTKINHLKNECMYAPKATFPDHRVNVFVAFVNQRVTWFQLWRNCLQGSCTGDLQQEGFQEPG